MQEAKLEQGWIGMERRLLIDPTEMDGGQATAWAF